MEKSIVKTVSTKKVKLSQIELQTTELDYKYAENCYYDQLSDDLIEQLRQELEAKKFKYEDLKVFYSLSHCQGDGAMFEGLIDIGEAVFRVKQSGRYYHYNSKNIELVFLRINDEEVYSQDFTEEQDKEADRLTEWFNDEYVTICGHLEKIGYEIIEEEDHDIIARQGFRNFLEINEIEAEIELYDINHHIKKSYDKTEIPKGMVKVCDSGNTIIELYIEDLTLQIDEKVEASVKEYNTTTISAEGGK
jgi:hypothetical protein